MNKIIDFFLDLLRIKNEKTRESLTQFVKFGIVGMSNVVISYIINIVTLIILKRYEVSIDYVIANIVSFLLSVLWSFYWNNKYVFNDDGSKRNILKSLLKTYVAYSFSCIILNNAFSFLWIEVFNISKYVAPIINLVVTVPINFVINKLWAFKK